MSTSINKINRQEQILSLCLKKNVAFFAYSLPNQQEIHIGIQKQAHCLSYENLHELEEQDGFVFAPFDLQGKHKAYFIQKEMDGTDEVCMNLLKERSDQKADTTTSVEDGKWEAYAHQIDQMLSALKTGDLDKVILSRICLHKDSGRDEALSTFLRLNQAYANAFVFLVDIPEVGLWMGASPERLILAQHNYLETVALAGTQNLNGRRAEDLVWEKKEREEQAFVGTYIENLLHKYQISNFNKKGPFSAQAANVAHLKTIYQANCIIDKQQRNEFVQALHPTPAVCGLPKEKAMNLIREVEQHDREYYAGYLGPVSKKGDLTLFVNLRSMKVLKQQMVLFVGGGITADSNPEKEWEETCHKAQTLLRVLKRNEK